MKIVIENIKQLVTPIDNNIKKGASMSSLDIKNDVSIYINNDLIEYIGRNPPSDVDLKIDAKNLIALPGFIDSHTHIPFYGRRWEEFYMRNAGEDYMEILKKGGGIIESVSQIRKHNFEEILGYNQKFVDEMLSMGVTSIEGKSGYGLNLENEIKQLKVLKNLKNATIISTFLGPHSVPKEKTKQEYLYEIIKVIAPKVRELNLADFADIFCEKGVFELEDTRLYLDEMKKLGFILRIHSDEIESIGGTKLAVEYGAKSADHLIKISKEDIDILAKSNTVANLLPGTSFFLNKTFAPARELINKGAAVSLSSDFNPGSCYVSNPNLVIHLAVTKLKMSPEEIVNAYTVNPANILNLNKVGVLKEGYFADIQLHYLDDYREIPYSLGHDTIKYVFKRGKLFYENRRF
jgi:imidazolonepropionase